MDAFALASTERPVDARFQQPPRSLAEPGALWLLEAGEADIFAAQGGLDDSVAPAGPYLFIGRIGAGTLVPGHGPDLECLVLRPAAGARLRRLTHLSGIGGAQAQVEAMQAWASALAGGLGARLWRPSNIDRVARPGVTQRLADRQSVTARGVPVWVEVPEGGAMLLGLEPVQGLLPLPPEAWLIAAADLELPVHAAPPAASLPEAMQGLSAFTDACVAMLAGLRSLSEIDESGRLEQRAQHDAEAAHRTAQLAADLLHAPPPKPSQAASDSGPAEPLFQTMVVVAKAAGIRPRIQRPTRLREQDIDTPPTMEEIARASGLRLRPVGLPAEWWKRDLGPLIGRDAKGEPLALLPRPGGYVAQPPDGPAQRLDEAAAEAISPRAWTMIEPLSDMALTPEQLARFVPPKKGDLWLAFGAALLAAFLGLGMPIAMSFATGSLIPGGNRIGLVELGIALACVGAANFVVQMAGDIAKHRLQAMAEAPLHAGLWDRLLRLPMPVLRRFNPSELSSRLGVAMAVPLGQRNFRLAALGYGTALAASLLMLVLYHPLGALVALGILLVQIGMAVAAGILKSKVHETGQALSGQADSLAIEAVGGIVKLRLSGVEHRFLAAWSERFVAMRRTKLTEEHIDTWQASAASFMSFLGVGLLFLMFMAGGSADNAAVAGFLMAFMIANGAANGLGQAFAAYYPLHAMRGYGAPLLQAQPEPTAGRIDPGKLSGHISMSNVAFGYEGSEGPLFSGLNLQIEPGEFVAIVGRSGCGKSTLVRLLLGLERPVYGSVAFDRQDLVSLDLGLLRRRVGTVMQGAQLPPGALIDVLRGFSEASEAAIWKALEQAAIAQDVRAMPLGIRTPIADAAHVLSGGQVQRLLLARALVNRPDVLILDEATSALDPATQAITTRTLAALTCTRIVIAHRLETIRGADRILVIEGGKVAHQGSFAELSKRGIIGHAGEVA
ncbi:MULTISPECIES: ATP-binding cassette domain-containing protein [Roseomonadaceae]|uniref:ATP-binding cassette domain-containing protein n=1 Tax=Falsiroseomonas oleicola TaxID=2801474 RepID=A0ABS6HCC5_9PROT|nr:ATP-binding cassette domain-containing protein [Roseomonas oleicola]MBU8545608.1 ATP-binding cassette domain-containing protein [Roseomonas oleicola]